MTVALMIKIIMFQERHTTFQRLWDLTRWLSGKESTCQCKRHGFNPWVGKIPWSRKWQPSLVFLPGKFHGQRSLVGYSPWGPKESDMTQQLNSNRSHTLFRDYGTSHSSSVHLNERPGVGAVSHQYCVGGIGSERRASLGGAREPGERLFCSHIRSTWSCVKANLSHLVNKKREIPTVKGKDRINCGACVLHALVLRCS